MVGSRYVKEPFDCARDDRFEAMEKVMTVHVGGIERRLDRIEQMILGLEKRLWTTVYGVVGVVLSQVVEQVMNYGP